MKIQYYSILVIFSLLRIISSQFNYWREEDYLPDDLQPQKYDLEIFTAVEKARMEHKSRFYTDTEAPGSRYWGTVRITVKCIRSTNKIILHQKDLIIHEKYVKIKLSGSDPVSYIGIKQHKYKSHQDQYIITLRKFLQENKHYEIEIRYSRPLGDLQMRNGYIFDEYYTEKGDYERLITYAVMEDSGARRVFPCFDQPGMKATFKISLRHRRIVKGISNAERISTKPVWYPIAWIKDEFEETIPMEAMSVTIALLDFSSTHSPSSAIDIKFHAEKSVFEKLQPFTKRATQIFQFFSDYFEVPYPFTKLDIIAIPRDLSSIAVSYGVIYMNQNMILNGLKQVNDLAGYELVSKICHAISQQWIGHTVTASKLEQEYVHIVLNTYLQTQCATNIEPKWELFFIEPDVINSFIRLVNSQDVLRQPDNPFLVTDILPYNFKDYGNEEFEKIYYLTRMMHFFLGDEIFKTGINNYVKKFKYSNSNYDDLWKMLTYTANTIQPDLLPQISVEVIMTSWLDQEGYPLITVTWKDKTKEIITISQSPFNVFGEDMPFDYEKYCWYIPLSYTTKSESENEKKKRPCEWLTCGEDLHLKVDMKKDDWFLIDLNVNGRVNYDESIWISIKKSLINNESSNVFDSFTRLRLISDMFTLAKIGKLSYSIVLDAMTYLPREENYEHWKLALEEFDEIRLLLTGKSVYKSFKKYIRGLLDSVFQKEEYQNLTQSAGVNMNLKSAIVESSCKYGVLTCREKIIEILEEKENLNKFPEFYQQVILCQGIKYGKTKHWNYILDLYKKEKEFHLRTMFLKALGCSSSEKILKRFIKWSKDGSVPPLHISDIWESLLTNRKAYKITKNFFIKNFDQMKQISYSTEKYLKKLTEMTVQKKDLDKLMELANSHGMNLDKSRYKAEQNIAWVKKNETILKNYFKNFFNDKNPKKLWNFDPKKSKVHPSS